MPSTNTRTPRPARQQSAARPPLLWRGHRVRERVAITTPDLKRVIRELAPAGAHDLALYMWMLASMQYVAGKDGRPDTATVSQTYQALAKSVNMSATSASTRTSNVTRAVKRLDEAKLVGSKRAPGRGTVIRLLRADGSGRPYAMPNMERGPKVILPGEFFSNGWHATLSKAALALLLAGCVQETLQWKDYGAKGRPGAWKMPRDVVEREYRIHHDAINKAKKELASFGLMFWEFDELNDEERYLNHVPTHVYFINKDVWKLAPAEAPRFQVVPFHDVATDQRSMLWMRLEQPTFRVDRAAAGGKVVPMPTTEGSA